MLHWCQAPVLQKLRTIFQLPMFTEYDELAASTLIMSSKALSTYEIFWPDNRQDIISDDEAISGYARRTSSLPGGSGKYSVEIFQSENGLLLSRAHRSFSDNRNVKIPMDATGNPVQEIQAEFDEPSLYISFIRDGRLIYQDTRYDQPDHEISGNRIYFGHMSGLGQLVSVEVYGTSTVHNLAIRSSLLSSVFGEEKVRTLFSQLGISEHGSGTVKNIPYNLLRMFRDAMSPRFNGDLFQLHAQAKVLEFLCNLFDYMETGTPEEKSAGDMRGRIQDLHAYLSSLTGQLPTLQDLSDQTGVPVRTLNEAFAREYGITIHAFMLKSRLMKAHRALERTDAPIKVIAGEIGYSHVNNFTAAFKREFGYPPGKLRR